MDAQNTNYPLEITVADLAGRLADPAAAKPVVLDVREVWEVQVFALDEFINIPLMDLPNRVNEVPNEGELVVLCHHGTRSAQAVEFLRQTGFDNAINLRGGIDAWAREIDLAMATY